MAKPPITAVDQAAADDALAFRAAVRDVKPLAHAPAAELGKPRRRVRVRKMGGAAHDLDAAMPLVPTDTRDLGVSAADTLSFRRPGVRLQTIRQLRRGLIPVEGELDLHGYDQSAARRQLAEFLEYARAAGRRCVRIIHGKGARSGARGPVLKVAVNSWLRRQPDVLAFTSARAIDGGSGAVYVLLRA
jgi:DNA-nicking Smr family endonuclease